MPFSYYIIVFTTCKGYLFTVPNNIIEAINFYNDLLIKFSDVIIVGDFNSFDKKPNRKEYQINIENKLKQFDIHNCTLFPRYVPLDGQNFETEITYYDKYKPYQAATNDYCFLKKSNNTNFREPLKTQLKL